MAATMTAAIDGAERLSEISHELPENTDLRYLENGDLLFTAYGCGLLEQDTEKRFIYRAVNLETGKSEVLAKKKLPLTTSGVQAMIEKIRKSRVAGHGKMETDRPFGENVSFDTLKDVLHTVFWAVLPQYGYTVREKQIELANFILEAINKRHVSLAEAEVGTGKTHAYLLAAILAKRGRLNDFWNMGYYPEMQYVDMAHMPIVISTSSIALQKALVRDYIPELSKILMKHGIIKTPLTAVIRKGKEHYVCEQNLRARLPFESDEKTAQILEGLLLPNAPIDLAEVEGLTAHVKRNINVPDRCDGNCPYYSQCRYLDFLTSAQSPKIDVQIVNHNYLLADTLHRTRNQKPLIPNYQMLIIDEAHKFLDAARQMYGVSLSSAAFPEILADVNDLNFSSKETQKVIRRTAKKLAEISDRLFNRLNASAVIADDEDDTERFAVDLDGDKLTLTENLLSVSNDLVNLLTENAPLGKGKGKQARIMWLLRQALKQLTALTRRESVVVWFEKPDAPAIPNVSCVVAETRLCAVPKDLDERLYKDLWSKGLPVILTSGTLSAGWALPKTPDYLRGRGGDFSHIRQTLGIERVMAFKRSETSKPSPFDYNKNALLYISEGLPFPDNKDEKYLDALAAEIGKLIAASHGHAAVLFTSYKAMDKVWERLTKRGVHFPMFRMDKGGVKAIEKFKSSKNGVLFASGSMWEGIDIPGDALSMLIIVKLPFAVPDPISEYERTLYKSMGEYINRVVVPEMLIKLKQGFGRLIRLITDTGVVAILDMRASERGIYRRRVIGALPGCRVTSKIVSVEQFTRAKKAPEYFE